MAKVLIVDDEADIEFLAKQKFRLQITDGIFDLLFAANGKDALDLMRQNSSIGVVVTDVSMPEMDGFTLIDCLKEINPTPKIIIMSAFGDTATWRKAMNKGVFDFITKPVDFSDLGNAILQALESPTSSAPSLPMYQLLLKERFPQFVHLEHPECETNILWDAFLFSARDLIVTGLSLLPSSTPFEIVMGAVHGILRSSLQETSDLSIPYIEEKLTVLPSSPKAKILIGHYNLNSRVFTYKTNDDFQVQRISARQTVPISSLSPTSLDPGDEVVMEFPPSFSRLFIRHSQPA